MGTPLSRRVGRALRGGRDRWLGRLWGAVVGVEVDRPMLALTFDDGPDPVTTPLVLDVLERHGARGTFFLIGRRASQHPDVVARIQSAGHAIGHHTLDHVSLPGLGYVAIHAQIRGGFAAIGPYGLRLFRPPFGHLDMRSWWIARRDGHEVVAWSTHAWDWLPQDTAVLTARIRETLAPGAIVMLHDAPQGEEDGYRARKTLLEALDRVLDENVATWQFVTVPELLASGRPRRRVRWRRPPIPRPPGSRREEEERSHAM